jgi:Tn3 transposase DDE domain
VYLEDSLAHRCFGDELVSVDEKADVLRQLDIPWLRRPIDEALESLFAELHQLWAAFDRDLRRGRLKHLEYNSVNKTLSWHKPKTNNQEAVQTGFYGKLQARDIADIFRFVNQQCGFLSAFTPLQPRYAKKIADEDSLMAVIIAQAMNHGNLNMAETSDISYHVLEATHQEYLRLVTLQTANDLISNAIAQLSIFPITPLISKSSVAASMARNSRWRSRLLKPATPESTSVEAREWWPIRCSSITSHYKAS